MKIQRVKLSDAIWLQMESRERPMHVATLLIYSLPENAAPDYVRQLAAGLRECTEMADPFNRRLANPSRLKLMAEWTKDFDPDMEYHVRHLALPYPGGERELGILISRLHSNPMDFNRPLWEYHIIEGLENRRFAIYFKMHHAIVDGIAGIRMLQRSMSTDPEDTNKPALWSAHAPASPSPSPSSSPSKSKFDEFRESLDKTAETIGQVGKKLVELMQAAQDPRNPAILPFQTPVSILNHRIHSQRRFATQLYNFARFKSLAKATDTTINDIVLALCGGSLRRFLKEIGKLPGRSLTAGIPVSLRSEKDQSSGPAVGFILGDLATNIADPVRRLEVIASSTRRAKTLMQGLPRHALDMFSTAVMAPYSLQILMGLEGRTRPVYNVPVSNIPGPQEHLYLRGARLEAMYPVSVVTHGLALNITCYSYAGTLSFGFAGCRDTLPHMQRIAVYTGEVLKELEQAVFGKEAPSKVIHERKSPSTKRATRKKSAS